MTSYIALKDDAAYAKRRLKRGGRIDVCDGPFRETPEMVEACLNGEFMNCEEFNRLTALRNKYRKAGIKLLKPYRTAREVMLDRMERRIGQAAHGACEVRGVLHGLGLDPEDLVKLDASRQFEIIGQYINAIANPVAKLAAATAMFDREGATMVLGVISPKRQLENELQEQVDRDYERR